MQHYEAREIHATGGVAHQLPEFMRLAVVAGALHLRGMQLA